MQTRYRFFYVWMGVLIFIFPGFGEDVQETGALPQLFPNDGAETALSQMPSVDPVKLQQEKLMEILRERGYDKHTVQVLGQLVVSGQQENQIQAVTKYRLDSTYYTKYGDRYREYYIYDKNDNFIKFEKHVWNKDSSRWEYLRRIRLDYDADGYLVESTTENWSQESSQWEPETRSLYTYNEDGRLTNYLFQRWFSDSSKWQNDLQIVYQYNAMGKYSQILYQFWDSNINEWVNSARYLYQYDENGRTQVFEEQIWDGASQQWVGSFRIHYQWDDKGRLIEIIRQRWDSDLGTYVNWDRTERIYENGFLRWYISYVWDDQNSVWVPLLRIEYTVNTDGKLESHVFYRWNSDSSRWDQRTRTLYYYNAQGRMDSLKYQVWNDSTGQWLNDRKDIFTWDANGNLSQVDRMLWDQDQGSWVPDKRRTFQYNIDDILEYFKEEAWDSNNNAWVESDGFVFFVDSFRYYSYIVSELFAYYSTITGIEDEVTTVTGRFHLYQNYPNPFNPVTTIRFRLPEFGRVQLEVYNALGQRIRTLVNQTLNAGEYRFRFDGTDLPSGVYYIRLKSERFQQTRKMLLIK